jgi:hypothetical protein
MFLTDGRGMASEPGIMDVLGAFVRLPYTDLETIQEAMRNQIIFELNQATRSGTTLVDPLFELLQSSGCDPTADVLLSLLGDWYDIYELCVDRVNPNHLVEIDHLLRICPLDWDLINLGVAQRF